MQKIILGLSKLKFMNNKSQAELIGIVILVILVVIGVFFLLFQQKEVDTKNSLVDAQLSQSMLSTMMKSHTECGPELSVVIQDCFGDDEKCPGISSCDYASDYIKDIFENTLEKWNKGYIFYVTQEDNLMIDFNFKECTEFKEKSALALAVLSEEPNIVVTLGVCIN